MKTIQHNEAAGKGRADDYEVRTCLPKDLTADEQAACLDILTVGGAVDIASARRSFPRSRLVAIARLQGQIVGVGAIKPERPSYAAKVARDHGVTFPRNTLELGYVAVHPEHRSNGLSGRLAEAMMAQYKERLFATTYTDHMKRTLEKAGFVKKGGEREGRKQNLVSFWEKE